jgi:hypothetical protein
VYRFLVGKQPFTRSAEAATGETTPDFVCTVLRPQRRSLPGLKHRPIPKRSGTTLRIVFGASLVALLLGGPGAGGSHAQSTSILIPNAGEVTTTSKVDNGVLAVNNQVVRNRSGVRECVGICFYAAKTATKTWVCRNSNCALDCSGREPVGGC